MFHIKIGLGGRCGRHTLLLIGLSLISGCVIIAGGGAAGAITGAAMGRPRQPDSVTTVAFTAPTDVATLSGRITLRASLTDTVWLRDVLSVRGRIRVARGDSLELDLHQARDATGTKAVTPGTLRAFVLAPRGILSTEETLRPQRLVGAVLGALVGSVTAYLLLAGAFLAYR